MKYVTLAIAAVAVLLFSGIAFANSVEVTVTSGPFLTSLQHEGSYSTLTIDDLSGTGRGWTVLVENECEDGPTVVGEVESVAGHPVDEIHGPLVREGVIKADPDYGMGRYEIRFENCDGLWTVTTSQ